MPVLNDDARRPLDARIERVAALLGALVGVVGVVVLLGWALAVPALMGSMNPVSALVFALAGAALWQVPHGPRRAPVIAGLGGLVGVIGVLKLIGAALHTPMGVDGLLFPARVAALGSGMTLTTAAAFTLLGVVVVLQHGRARGGLPPLLPLLLALLLLSGLPLLGALYGAPPLQSLGEAAPMTALTAALLVLLGTALIASRPERRLMQVLTGAGPGGGLARRLLPFAVLVPLILGALALNAEARGLVSSPLGAGLLVAGTIAGVGGALLRSAFVLHDAHLARRRADTSATEQAREAASVESYTQAIRDVAQLLQADLDPDEVAERTVATLCRVTDVDWGGLVRIEGRHSQAEWAVPTTIWKTGAVTAEAEQVISQGVPRGQGLVWLVIDRPQAQALYVDEYARQAITAPSYVHVGVRSAAYVPLSLHPGQVLMFVAFRLHAPRPWTALDRELFAAAARFVAVALERREHLQYMREAALKDGLTGLGNRRAFDDDLDKELARAQRHGHAVGVLMMDLDGLKAINDTWGHERGDALLLSFARALATTFRRGDRLYRLGGDEYAALLTHAGPEHRDIVLSRVRHAIEIVRTEGFPEADVSAGISFSPAEATRAHDLVRRADARMYDEKRARRAARHARWQSGSDPTI
ncbi:GGDEF domain-containing protein [Deinococcus maricopensis]|uniref:Diguanylate cyclase with GAF sensor n=1 Tax=Deinococcus maricopensis (strain DSM 21211 / LMG 22137 / NRRL B-23946 / LB-34) TaxID=709986 RepID=E8U4A2_DEIML|nr:sensor domain-containing diguanylate cyclase [Deinococcus maricopensis]ADV65939.1 diguanylate cyclase with GAF sensor [Deinococcus maricopensis DSM 21211]